jgi:di/tricarboxylate transporter
MPEKEPSGMFSEATFVFILIAVAAALMASNRVRFDIVALLVVIALMLSGVLSVSESLAGFGSPVIVLVVGLLIVGEMLARTGVARAVGNSILKHGGGDETRLLVLIMVGAAVLGSVMSSTAVVAIFIPIILRIARQTRLGASRLLLPMSYAALISGMLTLIATTPNIVVHEELIDAGFTGFGFFSFAPVGIGVLAVAIVYMLFVGRHLLRADESVGWPGQQERSIFELWDDYRGDREPSSLRLRAGSSLLGQSILDSGIEQSFGLSLLGIVRSSGRHQECLITPNRDTVLMLGDVLVVLGSPDALDRIGREPGIERFTQSTTERQKWLWDMGAATLLIHPDSQLIGKSLHDVAFHDRFNLEVVGLRRGGEAVVDFTNQQLAVADSLLVTGPWKSIQRLRELQHEVVLMEVPSERADTVPSYRKMPIALAILATMVGLTIFDVVPLVAAVLMAALAAVFTRCLTMEDAYRAIPWSSIVLIAGMLPLADALNATGGTQMIVDALMAAVGDASPYLMLTVIFWLTALLGLVLSNTASAVLVAPIAVYAAAALGVSPYAFGVAVLIAASAAYSTPVSTPVVTLVVEPGRYRFGDFLKIGIPLLFLTYLTTLLLAPVFFPFQ